MTVSPWFHRHFMVILWHITDISPRKNTDQGDFLLKRTACCTFLLFSPFRLVRLNTWVQWKHLTPERSIDLCLQTFSKLLLLLVPNVTTRSLYPECIANLELPIDAFYRESRSGVNIAKRNITTGLFGLGSLMLNSNESYGTIVTTRPFSLPCK